MEVYWAVPDEIKFIKLFKNLNRVKIVLVFECTVK